MSSSDEQLIVKYQQGDIAAFDTLYARHSVSIYSFLCNLVKRQSVADDLMQTVWEKVIARASQFSEQIQSEKEFLFRPYLFTIARNTANDYFRSSHVKFGVSNQPWTDDETDQIETLADVHSVNNDKLLEIDDLINCVEQHLSNFSPGFKEAFESTRDGFLSYAEAATILSVSVETIRSRVKSVLTAIKPCLEAHSNG